MTDEYIKVEDKKGGGWLIIRLNPDGFNDIIARTHSKFYAQDIVLAMRKYFEESPRDGIND